MRMLLRDARARGLKRMEGYVLGTNTRMLEFVRKLGFEVDFNADDPSVRLVHRAL